MKIRIKTIIILILIMVSLCASIKTEVVYADSLSDSVEEQLENLDFSKIEEYYEGISNNDDKTVLSLIKGLLNGEYNQIGYDSIKDYLLEIFLVNVKKYIAPLISLILISVIGTLFLDAFNKKSSEGLKEIINFVIVLSSLLTLIPLFKNIYNETLDCLQKINNINQIMSPIILTLMISSGANVSANVYKPGVNLFSNVIISVFIKIVIPLVIVLTILSIIGEFSKDVKLGRLCDFICSTIKWIIGIVTTIFSIYLSIQGISSAIYDGISIKATKYALSNSIPIIGGFVKDGFDLILAGSVLIKNSVGIVGIFLLFNTIISTIISLGIFSLLLKLVAGITENFSGSKTSQLCSIFSRSVQFVNVSVIMVGFMMFLSNLLLVLTANSFF